MPLWCSPDNIAVKKRPKACLTVALETHAGRKGTQTMWGKNNTREPEPEMTPALPARMAPPAPPAAQTSAGAIIGKSMRITGEIYTREALSIEGEVEGSIQSNSRLVVETSGKLNASVKASELDVRGVIQGNVEAVDRVVIRKGANIIGDVKTAGIVIEDGAYFKGGIDIAKSESKAAAATKA
jgi:cytoskeletal protein CcmA (bactofilin family)